ncbi:MAG: hypothetical protein WBD31_02080 [Rubripirellula sp.]
MESQLSRPADRGRSPTEGIALKRKLVIAGLIFGVILVACYAYLAVVLAPFSKRDADAKIAFEPLRELRPAVFDNAFGVYVIEFGDASGLSDSTAHKLTALNKLPSEYDLTLVLKTDAITDKSVDILSRLTTTDTIVLDGTGLSDDGIAALDQSLPHGTLSRRHGLDTNRPVRDGGEP